MKVLYKDLHEEIWDHVFDEYPKEIVGYITQSGSYRRCRNCSSDPEKCFKVSRGKLFEIYNKGEAIIHSHIDAKYLSSWDIASQDKTRMLWGVAFVNKGSKDGIHFFGKAYQHLLGRPFVHGIYDCYSVVKDYYELCMGMKLPVIVRKHEWWLNGENLILDSFKDAGFKVCTSPNLKIGDLLLWKLHSKVINHLGVYVGHGKILHQLNGRPSFLSDTYLWARRAKLILRNPNVKNRLSIRKISGGVWGGVVPGR